jgi:hypothetical protein
MDGLNVANLRRADDAINLEVTFFAGSFADADSLVGQLNVERFSVGTRINGYGADPQFFASTYDANGNFSAIRDEYFLKHILDPLPPRWPAMLPGTNCK